MAHMLSDDEVAERCWRAYTDLAMMFSLRMARLMAEMDKTARALEIFAELTSNQRDYFNALVDCGTPPLDAANEARRLSR